MFARDTAGLQPWILELPARAWLDTLCSGEVLARRRDLRCGLWSNAQFQEKLLQRDTGLQKKKPRCVGRMSPVRRISVTLLMLDLSSTSECKGSSVPQAGPAQDRWARPREYGLINKTPEGNQPRRLRRKLLMVFNNFSPNHTI